MHTIQITLVESPLMSGTLLFMAVTMIIRIVRWLLDILP